VADAEVVNLELMLADLSHVQRRLEKNTCTGDERDVIQRIEKALENGIPARSIGLDFGEQFAVKSMGLLTLKPMIYAFNVDEVDFTLNTDECIRFAKGFMEKIQYCDLDRDSYTVVSAKFESEISSLNSEDRAEYLESLGVESGSEFTDQLSYHSLPLLVKEVLDLSLVYTGPGVPPERSETTKTHILSSTGMSAIELASKLHGDIEKGFMHAEVINASDLIRNENYNSAKESGSIRMEGKDYMLEGGDVVLIKWK